MCKGTAPGILAQYGYIIIKQPRAGIELLQLFELDGKALHPLNTSVETILTPEARALLPNPVRDETFAPINGKHVQEVEAGLAVSILKQVIPGYRASLEAKYGRAQFFEFRFLDVERDSIDIVKTEQALERIATDELRGSLKTAGVNRLLFLITSLLRASDIGVKARAAGQVDLNAGVTAEELGEAKVTCKRNEQDESEIIFKGNAKLVFGVEARRFVFIDGKFRRLRLDELPPVALGAGRNADAALLAMDADGELIKPLSVLDVSAIPRSL